MWLRFAILGLTLVISSSSATNWAVLVAGSNGWGNYRHQADVCHAYQVLIDRGFPEENIITMMYDDIANNPDNPLPGQIINEPYGPDVYKNVKIDYKGDDVTPKNFLNVLLGNESGLKGIGSERVLKSNSQDMVFINFVDHGGVGILCFPSDNLFADDLEKTLRQMVQKQMFKKLVFYVEACEAGSMFDNILEEHNNIFVSTASAKDESSFGWYCSNPQLDTCLGDLYSISWLQHMDKLRGTPEGNSETLWHQYDVVRTLVNESHVQLYGDFQLGQDNIGLFFSQAKVDSKKSTYVPSPMTLFADTIRGVPSHEVEMHVAQTRVDRALPHEKEMRQEHLAQLIKGRKLADSTMRHMLKIMSQGKNKLHDILVNSKFSLSKNTYPCYKNLVQHFNKLCFNTAKNTYLLRYLNKFVNACNLEWISEAEAIQAMNISCNSKTRSITNIV